MKIIVTDLDDNSVEEYEYSKKNWRGVYACMRGGLVCMWAPVQCSVGMVIRTSGRLWEVKKTWTYS